MHFSRMLTAVPLAALLGACAPVLDPSLLPADQAEQLSIRINEVMLPSPEFAAEVAYSPWIEIVNLAPTTIRLYDYVVVTDGRTWLMPDVYLGPGGFYVLLDLADVDGFGQAFLGNGERSIAIMKKGSHDVVDQVDLPRTLQDESVARYPNGTGRFFTYPLSKVSVGAANPDLGFINKLASETEFRPRDSSPNAIVRHDGRFWILGGWSNFGHDLWYSTADVWSSHDGAKWELVNSNPPYSHYDSFVSWRGRIWAIGPSSFSSTDGVDWIPEKIRSRSGNRSVVFHDSILNVDGSRVMQTWDGLDWTILTEATPWGDERQQPHVVVYQDKIWVIGGASEYSSEDATIHSDVWASSDGIEWELITASANWTPRIWQTVQVYDDKIFMVNGSNWHTWPEENGNTSEIWFTDDGVDWLELPSENIWSARHASFSVPDEAGGLLVAAGYGHGGVGRIYNDAWILRASIYFSKPSGDIHDLSTWGKNHDGTGASPASFGMDNQIFILANRASFAIDDAWSVSGAGSRIIVGDGNVNNPVWLDLTDGSPATRQLYLSANSTTVAWGGSPTVLYRHPSATLIVN